MSDLALVMVGVLGTASFLAAVQLLPHLWHWLRFKVWWDYRYSAGYMKGFAKGRDTVRWESEE